MSGVPPRRRMIRWLREVSARRELSASARAVAGAFCVVVGTTGASPDALRTEAARWAVRGAALADAVEELLAAGALVLDGAGRLRTAPEDQGRSTAN